MCFEGVLGSRRAAHARRGLDALGPRPPRHGLPLMAAAALRRMAGARGGRALRDQAGEAPGRGPGGAGAPGLAARALAGTPGGGPCDPGGERPH